VVELKVGNRNLPFPGEVVYSHSQQGGAFGVHFTGKSADNLCKLRPLYQSTIK
jgi:hypothetical protein